MHLGINKLKTALKSEKQDLDTNYFKLNYKIRNKNCFKFIKKYLKIINKIEKAKSENIGWEFFYSIGNLYLTLRDSYCCRYYREWYKEEIDKKIVGNFENAVKLNYNNSNLKFEIAKQFLKEENKNIRLKGQKLIEELEHSNVEKDLLGKIKIIKNYYSINVILFNDNSKIISLVHLNDLKKKGINAKIIKNIEEGYKTLENKNNYVIICDLPFHNKKNENEIKNLLINKNFILKIAATTFPHDEKSKQFLNHGFDVLYNIRFSQDLIPISEFIYTEILKKLEL